MLGAFGIFRFDVGAREHRHQLIIFFVGLDDALEHFGCFVRGASRNVSFQHAAQRFPIVAHELQCLVIGVESFVFRCDLMQASGCLNECSRGFVAHVLFQVAFSKF